MVFFLEEHIQSCPEREMWKEVFIIEWFTIEKKFNKLGSTKRKMSTVYTSKRNKLCPWNMARSPRINTDGQQCNMQNNTFGFKPLILKDTKQCI